MGDAFMRRRRAFSRDMLLPILLVLILQGDPTGGDALKGTAEIALEILFPRADGEGQPVTESTCALADAQTENERKAKAFPEDGGGWGALC